MVAFAASKTNVEPSQSNTYIEAMNVAARYVGIVQSNTSHWKNATIKFEFPLYDFDGYVTAYLFSVKSNGKDSGYLIISANEKPIVLESAREGIHPYHKLSIQDQAIYVGATMYYIKHSSDQYYDIREGNVISRNDLKSKGTIQGKIYYQNFSFNKSNNNLPAEFSSSLIKPQTIISYSYKLISGVPDFSWYKGCSPTSFSNIVKYWDNNGYPNLVQSNTTTNQLIETMANYMNTNSNGGTDWQDRVTGMVNYWKDRNYNVSVSRISASFSSHKTEMNNNRPDIINTVGDATYSNHDMTGVGYEEYQDTEQGLAWFRWVIVHDTWPETPTDVYIYLPNLSWNETVKVVPN